jgi:multidrug/hemolysin transport system permease protein
MTELKALIRRNNKLFLRDKGVFFTSLITPMILLILYVSFLRNVYADAFTSVLSAFGFAVEEKVMDGLVAGQLLSSLLAVCCVTVAFCSNMVMVTDKVTGAIGDIMISPVKAWKVAVAYYVSCFISTLSVCLTAMGIGFIYMASAGWYLSISDVVLLLCDTVLLTLFGVALSSLINFFLSTQGQISAVGSMVSSCYGFISGAYMPISQFSEGLQKVISFLPGTYGTVLLRYHSMRGALSEMKASGVPEDVIKELAASADASICFFENQVPYGAMYAVIGLSIAILMAVYILLNKLKRK